jgi:hypothetical protein
LVETTENKSLKHIDTKNHLIREKLLGKELCLKFIKSEYQLADMTKRLSKIYLERFCKELNVCSIVPWFWRSVGDG